MQNPRHVRRVLVIARGHLGDVISALPALRDLRSGFRNARITVMTNEYVRGVLEGCPFVDDIIYGFGYRPRGKWIRAASRLRVLAQIAGRYDVAIALRSSPHSSPILSLVSGARARVGFNPPGLRGRLLTHNLGWEPTHQSNRLTNASLVRALGLEANPVLPRLDWTSPADRARTDRLLAAAGLNSDTPFAAFQVATHWGCYEWSSAKWAAVADHLAERLGLRVVVVGSGEEFEHHKFREISELSREPVSVQGKTSLPMLFSLVSRACLVVAGDSALTQVAMAQRVPAVIMFGIEPQARNGPLPEDANSQVESVQHWDGPALAPAPNPFCRFGASQCHTAHCCENNSFRQISADEICAKIDRVLGGRVALAGS